MKEEAKKNVAKRGRPKKVVTPKVKSDIENKVKDLTKDLDEILDVEELSIKKKSVDTPIKKTDSDWLKEEFDRLVEENKRFEAELIELRNRSSNSDGNVDFDAESLIQIKLSIKNIYNELRNNLSGNNPSNQSWENVKIRYLLERFRGLFDFLE